MDGILAEVADRWRALDPLLPVPDLPAGVPELAVSGALGAPRRLGPEPGSPLPMWFAVRAPARSGTGWATVHCGPVGGLAPRRRCGDGYALDRPVPGRAGRAGRRTPGLSTPAGSSCCFAAPSAAANRSGRCRSYQGRWSRPTAW
jgi:hypothetical protein